MPLNTVLYLIPVFIAVIAVIVTVWGVYSQNKMASNIAKASGQLRKANVNCHFFNKDISKKEFDTFCFWYPGGKEDFAIFFLVFLLENDGDIISKDGLLTIKASGLCLVSRHNNKAV